MRVEVEPTDVLTLWIRPSSVARIRAIQSAIHDTLESPRPEIAYPLTLLSVDDLPDRVCFFYCSLFATVRSLLARFGATNPTWLKRPLSHRHRVAPSWSTLVTQFLSSTDYFARRLSSNRDPNPRTTCRVMTGSSAQITLPSAHFDAVLTSPPYATRIDYVTNTLPELAVLGATDVQISQLRRQTMGTPLVSGTFRGDLDALTSECAVTTIARVAKHQSKASPTYYRSWLGNYLYQLDSGTTEMDRIVARDGTICVVVQDSYYKEILIDLQRIVVETLTSLGRTLYARHDYSVRQLRSRMNPRARRHTRDRNQRETLLVFR